MNFFRYIFRFLYVRNWHTGAWELSRRRVYWFTGVSVILVITILLIFFAQLPVVYERTAV